MAEELIAANAAGLALEWSANAWAVPPTINNQPGIPSDLRVSASADLFAGIAVSK